MGFACCSVSGGVRLGRSEQCRSRHRLCVAVALPSQMVEDVNVGVYFYHYSTDTSQWEPPPSFLHDVCRGLGVPGCEGGVCNVAGAAASRVCGNRQPVTALRVHGA